MIRLSEFPAFICRRWMCSNARLSLNKGRRMSGARSGTFRCVRGLRVEDYGGRKIL